MEKYKRLFEEDGSIQYRRYGGKSKPLPIEIPKENYNEKQKEILRSVNPLLPLDRLSFGCEGGLGGGCDPIITEFDEVEIKVDPKTGRGTIVGKGSMVKRFVPIAIKTCQSVLSK